MKEKFPRTRSLAGSLCTATSHSVIADYVILPKVLILSNLLAVVSVAGLCYQSYLCQDSSCTLVYIVPISQWHKERIHGSSFFNKQCTNNAFS